MPSATEAAPVHAHIALIGAANLDIAARIGGPVCMADSNPGSIHCSPGGVARNIAENLLRLGHDVRLVSVLGDDPFAAVLRKSAAAIGLDLAACTTLLGQRTATYLSLHGDDGDMRVAVNDMAILELMTPDLLRWHATLVQRAAVAVVDCNVRADVLTWLCCELAHPRVFAEAVSVAKCERLLPVLPRLHLLKANALEAQRLSGLPVQDGASAVQAARALQGLGARQVVISLGAQGAVWCDAAGKTGQLQARPVAMVSATGAGDALLAGLVHGHLRGMALDQALSFAMACAELTLSCTFATSPALCVEAVWAQLQRGAMAREHE